MHTWPERDGILDGQPGVERRVTVLKHHLHPPAQIAKRKHVANRLAVEHDVTLVRRDEADHKARHRRFAAA
jgi:hypothetical protein